MSTPAAPKITSNPVMIQEQALIDTHVTPRGDPWSGWAKLVDVADESAEEAVDVAPVGVAPELEPEPEADEPTPTPTPQPAELSGDLVTAVAQLASELADERRRRTATEEGRRRAEQRLHAAEVDAAGVSAELTTARARIVELERDRDEVIRRAEELLTAVRERADQRLASELDAAGRHWSELLEEERRRVEALGRERAALTTRVEDAWLATAVLRRARPLRLPASEPETPAEAEEEVLEALDEYETDPAFAAESPELADEIEHLRQRLRARVHKPVDIDTVEDGVDQLREARLARDAQSKGRRRR